MKSKKSNSLKILSLGVLCLVVGYGAGSLFSSAEKCVATQASVIDSVAEPLPELASTLVDGHYYLGDKNAPITVVEYTDYQCPYCQRHFFQTFEKIKNLYIETGLVRYTIKDVPLSFHPAATNASIAAKCAGEQNKYWEMHEKIFAYQSGWAYADDVNATLSSYAGDLGLNTNSFNACLTSGKYDKIISADIEEANALGFSGTPSFMINQTPLIGALPLSAFEKVFDSITANLK